MVKTLDSKWKIIKAANEVTHRSIRSRFQLKLGKKFDMDLRFQFIYERRLAAETRLIPMKIFLYTLLLLIVLELLF